MGETPRRKRLQMHLSTAVVMMIAAGGLVWANVVGREQWPDFTLHVTKSIVYGWPYDAARIEWTTTRNGEPLEIPLHFTTGYGAGIDIAVALATLIAVWVLCEWWIRRLAGRKATSVASEAPRTRHLPIHLSTAVVMMIAAGGIVWANTPGELTGVVIKGGEGSPPHGECLLANKIGWPIAFTITKGQRLGTGDTDFSIDPGFWLDTFHARILFFDVLVALAVLFTMWSVCDWWIRRRAARKGM